MYDNKYKLIGLLIISAVIFSLFTIYVYSTDDALQTSAKSAALYEPETKQFLYTKNAKLRLSMASTTKIMTAVIALEKLHPDQMIEADERSVGTEGSSIYLEVGERLRAEDLVYALMLQSANDAAEALAYTISGGIDEFSLLMNQKADELGLCDTSFKNPHGLDCEEHYTSAHDLAIITAYALENPTFKKIASTYKKEIVSSHKTRILVNHNKLLKSYDGCIGVKTGYTKKSGRSLVSAAEKDGLTMISVTINAPDDWRDHERMLDYGFSRLKKYHFISPFEYKRSLPVIGGDKENINLANESGFSVIMQNGITDFNINIKLPRYLTAPVNQGEAVGVIVLTGGNKNLAEVPIVATEAVNKAEKKGFFSIFKK